MATEAEKAALYTSLLRAIGNECQDRLCARNEQHAWSDVTRTPLQHDRILRAPGRQPRSVKMRFKSERHCLNCGKKEVW